MKIDLDKLTIVHYPDPRLRTPCQSITHFGDWIDRLAERMRAILKESKGVGLAAPQVGLPIRLFIMNMTGEEKDAETFVNPVLRNLRGTIEAEEGCLSMPQIHVQVRRAATCTLSAQDARGNPVEMDGAEWRCRVWQHETDHLNGVLITDRMGPGDRIATRRQLMELERAFKATRAGASSL
ncbi:Peptide deformylase [Phycisphaerae bacterium RAS1]|nr:Peptide deformylase [Phycisphaerae bacterium RAS1]